MTRAQQAVELYAKSVEAIGPAWRNPANSVRAGYRNHWIEAGIRATERALKEGPDED